MGARVSTARNHSARRFWLAAFLLFAVWIFVTLTGCDGCPIEFYVMENGAKCKRRAEALGPYGSTVYFECDDGKMYRDARNVAFACEKSK